jgi:hypothetical protein
LTRYSASVLKVLASSDLPARVMLCGFPNILNPGQFLDLGLTDLTYRVNTADVSLDLAQASHRWGNYKDNQWYAAYALASGTAFVLKGMPLMRFSSQATQVITLRNNANTANIGYGFATDSLANYKLLVLSGTSKGLVRTITNNNNDNGTAGTITYSGSALSMSQGDWFVVCPNEPFRWLRNFFLKLTGGNPDLDDFEPCGDWTSWKASKTYDYRYIDPLSKLQQVAVTLTADTAVEIILNQQYLGSGTIAGITGYGYPSGLLG